MRPSRQAVRRNPHRLGVSGFAGCQNLPVDKGARTFHIGHNASVKRTSAALMAVPLAASMLLAGCGGDAKPDSPSSSTPTSSSTTAAPTTTAPPTSASPTTDPNIPVAARAHTPAGAEAFVRYFYSQLNVAWSKPQAGLISALSVPTCKTCLAFEGTAADLASKHQHYRDDVFVVKSVGSIGESEVLVVGTQPPGAVVNNNGSVVKSRTQAQPAKFSVTVAWSSQGWRISEIRVLK
jgi:Family of unknown function (DUF6318)